MERAIEEGSEQHRRSSLSLFLSAIAAGLILGFAGMCVALVTIIFPAENNAMLNRLATAFVYPFGFIICIMSGTQLFTEHMVGACLFFVYQMWKKQQVDQHTEQHKNLPYSPDELRLENVTTGGVLHLTGIGPDMEDFDVNILGRHIYREGEFTWYELEGDKGDSKVWIEFEEDDELEISIKIKDLKLRELGISKSDLDKMDDREDGDFEYEREKFYYEDSGQAVFYRNGIEENAEKFYYWDFENDNGDKYISAESWDGEIEASLSYPVKPSQVTVYSLSK